MFEYFTRNCVRKLAVCMAPESWAKIGDIDAMCLDDARRTNGEPVKSPRRREMLSEREGGVGRARTREMRFGRHCVAERAAEHLGAATP